jgi:hypothetical protein
MQSKHLTLLLFSDTAARIVEGRAIAIRIDRGTQGSSRRRTSEGSGCRLKGSVTVSRSDGTAIMQTESADSAACSVFYGERTASEAFRPLTPSTQPHGNFMENPSIRVLGEI